MIYEFIATITAGFGMAGIALIVRHLSKLGGKLTPKWLLPVFASAGMLGFQIHQEYHWHEQQIKQAPIELQVIKTVQDTSWYKPWSYLRPQTVRFMAISEPKAIHISHSTYNDTNQTTDSIKRIDLYLFERRISTKVVPQWINCETLAHADALNPKADDNNVSSNLSWQPLTQDDVLIQAVCHGDA